MNALCIVVDGLRAGFLGCYGNTWVQTPAIDRLAATGFVFDQALIDSPRLEDAYCAYWLGQHAFACRDSIESSTSLLQALASAGIATALITDEESLAADPLVATLDEIVQLPVAEMHAAGSSDESQFAALFSAAADWIESARAPFCLWLHAQGMQAAWDAPAALRERYSEEDDVPIPKFVEPPNFWLPAEHDPDQLLALRWAYAAQVSLLDRCLEALLEWFDGQPAAQDTLLVLLGSRGYPLGEHGRVGLVEVIGEQTSLHAELLHVPCIVRLPGGMGAADRSQALIQPADLARTLADWFQLASDQLAGGRSWLPLVRGDTAPCRDRACMHAGDSEERAIRTAAWHFIQPAAENVPRKLFGKPDDRWEMNEVANRCGDVADLLGAALTEAWRAGQQSRPWDQAPLADGLT